MIVLDFDEPTPSINTQLGHHWSHKHKLRKRWAWLTKRALLAAKFHDTPKYPKAIVTIERYGSRILDADNCRAGMKILMDQLVQQGLLLDDKPAVIGEPVIRQFAGRVRGTRVCVEQAT